jgi:hypothetical protein
MKKSSLLSLITFLIAVAGVVIALAAYFKNRSGYLFDEDDDFLFDDDEDLEYYSSGLEDEEDEVGSDPAGEPSREEGDLSF